MNTDIRRVIEGLQRDLDEQSHLTVVDATLCHAIREAIRALLRAQTRIEQIEA